MQNSLDKADYLVIGLYFVVVASVALYVYLTTKNSEARTAKSYFLGNKDLTWWVIGASLFASNIGSEHLIGLAGAGANGDFVAGQFELIASLILLILAWVFVPFYMRSGVFTMPEFLERRYDSWARGYLTWVSIVAYILTKISVTIFAGGVVFTSLLGIDFWAGALLVVIFTGIYTVIGGLKVVAYTDFIQLIVLLGGSIAITYFGLTELGGLEVLVERTSPNYLSLWRDNQDTNFPWSGIILGAPILGVWYWCTDQFIVQRVISAKNLNHARKGSIFGGYLKLLPIFIFVIPGVIAYALSVGENALISFPQVDGVTNYDSALPLLTMAVLPTGLRGLVVAGLLAALMSSLSSVFNSCSTLFTMDVYRKRVPTADNKQLVLVGKITTVVLVILGLAWIPMMNRIDGGLFQKLQSIQAYISPPIAAVFIFGIFYKKASPQGAKFALLTGACIGTTRLILELNKASLKGFLLWITEVNFLHFAVMLFMLCGLIIYVFRREPRDSDVINETNSPVMYQKGSLFRELKNGQIFASALLVIAVMLLWVVFK